jgi:hypothetical protein
MFINSNLADLASMKLLLASDIFGDTPGLRSTAKAMCGNFIVISPHSDRQLQFSTEQQAYAAFLACGGVTPYAQKLAQAIDVHNPDALVGFSAGATAGWLPPWLYERKVSQLRFSCT